MDTKSLLTKKIRTTQQKRRGVIEKARRGEPVQQPITEIPVVLYIVFLAIFLVLFISMLFFVGAVLFTRLQPEWTQGILAFPVHGGYALFLLLMIIPSILLSTLIIQIGGVLIPSIGNGLVLRDTVRILTDTSPAISITNPRKPSFEDMVTAVQYIDLQALQRQTAKRMGMGFLLMVILVSPFMWQSARMYLGVIDSENMLYQSFFDWEARNISTDGLRVTVGVEEVDSHLEPLYELTFADGTIVDVWELSLPSTPTENLLALTQWLVDQNVSIRFQTLPDLSRLRPSIQEHITGTIESIREIVNE